MIKLVQNTSNWCTSMFIHYAEFDNKNYSNLHKLDAIYMICNDKMFHSSIFVKSVNYVQNRR
jgi:hypothetical protein